jgi:PEP-CTERM motif
LDVENSSVVNINGNVVSSGIVRTGFNSNVYPTGNQLNVNGNYTNNAGGTLSVLGAGDVANMWSLTNYGNVNVAPGATLNLTWQNGGITDVWAGSSYLIQGDFNDTVNGTSAFAHLTNIYGAVTIDNGQSIQDNPNGLTLTIAQGGSLTVLNGSTFWVHSNIVGQFGANVYTDPSTLIVDGTFYNYGANITVDGNSVFSVGSMSNSGPLLLTHNAAMTVNNGFYQLASGTLGESIDATGFSILTVNGGAVVLDGTLDVLLDPNFNPTVGSFYKFLLFGPGSLSGTFASIQNALFNNGSEKWTVIYNNSGGYVELLAQSNGQPTPEPTSFLLLGSGLIGVSYGLRRRLHK